MTTLQQLSATPGTEWQTHGLCRAEDSGVFFAPAHFEHKPEREAREAKARAICAACPVRLPCLEWALATQEPFGVWGGCSEGERKQILMGKRQAG
jgi:WhiB family redox-sensing transcriptional regulator